MVISMPFNLVKSDSPITPGSWRSINITSGAGPCMVFQVRTRLCRVRNTCGYCPGYCSCRYSNSVMGFNLGSRRSIGSNSLLQTSASGSRLVVFSLTRTRMRSSPSANAESVLVCYADTGANAPRRSARMRCPRLER